MLPAQHSGSKRGYPVSNRNFPNGGKQYSYHVKPVSITCNFIVDAANGNGTGIRSLKGPGMANVFMHTSATPLSGNPNPAAGYIMVQLADNYNRAIFGAFALNSPVSGTPLTSVTAGLAYTIVSLGTTTAAQWAAVGVLPSMMTAANNSLPQVGLSFIATASQAIGGTGAVEVPSNSGITNVETVGDPNSTIAPGGTPGLGAVIILQCLKNDVLTAPADNTVISLEFIMNDSSVSGGSPTPGN